MEESEKSNLFVTFQQVIYSIIEEKRKNPKGLKLVNKFKGKINIGLQIEEDLFFWVNLKAENGNVTLNRGKLDDYDLELLAAPEDLLFFANGENSTLHMISKKNRFGLKKLKFSKGSTGKRNLGMLMTLSKLLVLD